MNRWLLGAAFALLSAGLQAQDPNSAEAIYQRSCVVCHAAGAAGAPKPGDKAAWETRMKERGGMDGMLASIKQGRNGMPPMGLCPTCTDDQFKAVVEYMSR